ncbi:hypothetical protein Glove_313g60 [Diversispora epigaea]|uniref:Uncharacterized protein n=1 Tax=Diversispora epigaea TaxID=1348612 RepID=A0A397HR34_9GLOM|nr:hypothetical protein Glove_313g60 [Diversispora epigaea]
MGCKKLSIVNRSILASPSIPSSYFSTLSSSIIKITLIQWEAIHSLDKGEF